MSTYTITVKDEADEVLGRHWGFLAIEPEDQRTVQEFNQDYMNTWVQNKYNKQFSDETIHAAQLAAADTAPNIIVN